MRKKTMLTDHVSEYHKKNEPASMRLAQKPVLVFLPINLSIYTNHYTNLSFACVSVGIIGTRPFPLPTLQNYITFTTYNTFPH